MDDSVDVNFAVWAGDEAKIAAIDEHAERAASDPGSKVAANRLKVTMLISQLHRAGQGCSGALEFSLVPGRSTGREGRFELVRQPHKPWSQELLGR